MSDRVRVGVIGTGAISGAYLGMAPTGSAMSYDGITLLETRGDRIAHLWVSTNLIERLRGLTEAARAPANAAH